MPDVRKEDVKVIQHGSGTSGLKPLYEARYGDIRVWSGVSAEEAVSGVLLLARVAGIIL